MFWGLLSPLRVCKIEVGDRDFTFAAGAMRLACSRNDSPGGQSDSGMAIDVLGDSRFQTFTHLVPGVSEPVGTLTREAFSDPTQPGSVSFENHGGQGRSVTLVEGSWSLNCYRQLP
jgi:hypothetical protein